MNTYQGVTLDNEAVEVLVEQGVIAKVTTIEHQPDLPLMAPPLVDLQHNGAIGHDYSKIDHDEGALDIISNHLKKHGVGRVQATFVTRSLEQSLASLRQFDKELSSNRDLDRFFCGIFYEGNYMSPDEGWRGIHDPAHMRAPRWEEWARLQDAAGGRIRVFNIDPEWPGALETIREAVGHGLRVTLGHCGPQPDMIRAAADAGADLVTHFGNGAPPLVHRHRNPFWTWLADDRYKLGLIADGFHLPNDVILAAAKAKGRDKIFIVSDAGWESGSPPGDYGDFVIEENGYCHVKGQDLLAAAWHQLDRGVEKLRELGWTLAEAWAQASTIPARIMHLELPRLEVGELSEYVLVTEEGPTAFSFKPMV